MSKQRSSPLAPLFILRVTGFGTAFLCEVAAVAVMRPTKDAPARETKLTKVIELLSRPEGATVSDIADATGWQNHTIRSALSHAIGKKRGYKIVSDKPKGGKRIYRIV